MRACVRTLMMGVKRSSSQLRENVFSLSLSLLISNRSHGLENLDLDLSPLDPILISCVSPPLATRPPTRARSSPPSGCTRTTRRPRQLRRRRRRRGDPSFGIGYKYIFLHDRVFGWSGVMIPRPSTTRERRGILGRKVERLLESKISWTRELAPTSSKINPFFIELCPSPLSFSLSLPLFSLSLSVSSFFSTTSNRRLVSYRCVDIIPIQFVRSILSVEGG